MSTEMIGDGATSTPPRKRWPVVPMVLLGAVALIVLLGAAMFIRAERATNHVALISTPKGVTVVAALASTYRPTRKYIGTLEPWVQAKVGPQLVSAYVDTVLVRPGASVHRGDVIATLDCRNASAASQAIAMQARSLEAKQEALAHEATRVSGLLDGGFVSPNEAEGKTAESASQQAELLATRAKLAGSSLEVSDCILRAPFDGEVADRMTDPGAFVRPGSSIVTLVDRRTIRVSTDAPEVDFAVVAPGTPVKIHTVATSEDLVGTIARRAPAADSSTRTLHFEVDLPDPERRLPVGTTGEIVIEVGNPVMATEVPLNAASIRGNKATLFTIEDNVAHSAAATVLGEKGASLFLDPSIHAGINVVIEGRSALVDGDRVSAKLEPKGLEGPKPPHTRIEAGNATSASIKAAGKNP